MLTTVRVVRMSRLGRLTMRLRGMSLVRLVLRHFMLGHPSVLSRTTILFVPAMLIEVLLYHGHHPHRTCSRRRRMTSCMTVDGTGTVRLTWPV